MPELGLALLVLVGLGIVFTGLPAAVVLIGVASFGGAFSVAMGVVLSLWAGRFVAALLYGLEARDALTIAGAVAVLAATGVVAGWLPARRAARVDPVIALRTE